MKKLLGICLFACLVATAADCRIAPDQVVKKAFPECFAKPMIGASSGAKCGYDKAAGEWRIIFWHGWGDCPAGCINKEDTNWYKVDGDARIFECDSSFQKCRQMGKDELIKKGKSPDAGTTLPPAGKDSPPPLPKPDSSDKIYCEANDQCFWYGCCETAPMSKLYSRNHYKELYLSSPERQECDLKCMHDMPPADAHLACVYRQCTALDKNAPAIDPKRPAVWVGRSRVIGQCQAPSMPDNNAIVFASANLPPPIKWSLTLPPSIKAGPQFSKWISEEQKRLSGADPSNFSCKACDICKTFYSEYALIFFDDLLIYQSRTDEWMRVDK